MTKLAVVIVLSTLAVAAGGCAHNGSGSQDGGHVYDLATVVEAVQYAIDDAALRTGEAWAATKEEIEHWSAACAELKENRKGHCNKMQSLAEPLCEKLCGDNYCSAVDDLACAAYWDGEALGRVCSNDADGQLGEWCAAAKACAEVRKEQARTCNALASIALPQFEKAELTLNVKQVSKQGGSGGLLVVEFGSYETVTSSSAVKLELKPRVRSEDYGSVGPLVVESRAISEDARRLAGDLADLIVDAVRSTTLELGGEDDSMVRPPLAMSGFRIDFNLGVSNEGKLSIGKEWEGVPANLEVGGEWTGERSNSLALTYARK